MASFTDNGRRENEETGNDTQHQFLKHLELRSELDMLRVNTDDCILKSIL